MSSSLEVGSTIVRLIGVGIQLGSLLYPFVSSYSNAPKALCNAQQEIGEFCIILQELQVIVSDPNPLDSSTASEIDTGPLCAILGESLRTFNGLENQLKKLKLDELKYTPGTKYKLNAWRRALWGYKDKDMETMVLRVQTHKETLRMLVSVLNAKSINVVKELMRDLYELLDQGIESLPSSSSLSTLDVPSKTAEGRPIDSYYSYSKDNVVSIITTRPVVQSSTMILPSLQATLSAARPYRNRSISGSVLPVASSKRRKPFRRSVLSLPISINTITGISLAESPPIAQILLNVSSKVLDDSDDWLEGISLDPSNLDSVLTEEERAIWGRPTPRDLEDSLLLKAVSKGMTRIVHLLLLGTPMDPEEEEKPRAGDTALGLAVNCGSREICQMLIGAGADVKAVDRNKEPLLFAACRKSVDIVRVLLDAGADIEARSKVGETPLFAACSTSADITKVLLAAGSDIEAKDHNGETPLFTACRKSADIVQVLLDAGADIGVKDHHGETPLFRACRKSADMVKILLGAGADIEAKSKLGETPLFAACNTSADIAKVLLAAGADTEAKNKSGETMLFIACRKSADIVKILLDVGADINAKTDSDKETPLFAACRKSADTVKLLLDAGADVDARSKRGKTSLFAACRMSAEVVKMLLDAGADIEAKDHHGETPLFTACRKSADIVEVLLDAGADIEAKSNNGETPLLEQCVETAYLQDSMNVVKLLVSRGANVRAKNSVGKTVLELAVLHKRVGVLQVLLAGSAGPGRGFLGDLPLSVVEASRENSEIGKLLQGALAKNASVV